MQRNIGVTAQDATVNEVLNRRQNLGDDRAPERPAPPPSAGAGGRPPRPVRSRRCWRTDAQGILGRDARHLDLAAGLVTRPPVLFLDEPTTGLDPAARLRMWNVIRELVADGVTLLLTTQYLDEADKLADRIVVIDHGHVIAGGTRPSSRRRSAEHGSRSRSARPIPPLLAPWNRSWPAPCS